MYGNPSETFWGEPALTETLFSGGTIVRQSSVFRTPASHYLDAAQRASILNRTTAVLRPAEPCRS
jgi:hypothetical protein